jgi:DNA-binding NarL/FixJ family response regulator
VRRGTAARRSTSCSRPLPTSCSWTCGCRRSTASRPPAAWWLPARPHGSWCLTTFDLDELVYSALQAGASGFLLKESPPELLLAGIRTVAAGEQLLAPSVTRRLVERFSAQGPPAPPPSVASLTARELEVLQLVARAMTNAEIARELFVTEATVKTHVARLLMKLGLRDRVQAVVLAYESGLVRAG